MRVIGGEFRSRRLETVPGRATRPTSDKLRETLFDVLGAAVAGSVWYDCFAGSGAVGIEALSRGAAHAVFIESRRAAARALRKNIATLGLSERCSVLEGAVLPALQRATRAADFVFLDPPYQASREYRCVLDFLGESRPSRLLRPAAMVIAEHSRRLTLKAAYGALRRFRVLRQGDSALSFYNVEVTQK